jgi:hypothetical protein
VKKNILGFKLNFNNKNYPTFKYFPHLRVKNYKFASKTSYSFEQFLATPKAGLEKNLI